MKNFVQSLYDNDDARVTLQGEMCKALGAIPKAKRKAQLMTWIAPVAAKLNLQALPSETGVVTIKTAKGLQPIKEAEKEFRNFLNRKVYSAIKSILGDDSVEGFRSAREKNEPAFDAGKIAKQEKARLLKRYSARQVAAIIAKLG